MTENKSNFCKLIIKHVYVLKVVSLEWIMYWETRRSTRGTVIYNRTKTHMCLEVVDVLKLHTFTELFGI